MGWRSERLRNSRYEIQKRKIDEPNAENGWDQSVASDKIKTINDNPYGSEYVNLNKEEQLVLATAFTEGSTSNYRMHQLLGKNSLEVGKILYSMVGRAMHVPVNRGRWTSYSLNYEYLEEEKSRSKSQGVKVKE